MKRKMPIIISFTLLISSVIGQSLPEDLLFSYEIEERIANGDLRIPSASYYYTYIGNYHEAIATYDIPVSWGVDTLELQQFQIKPALDRIIEEAREKQIVIISESHLKPQHRIFAKEIIVSLANHGFTHLGLETFAPDMTRTDQLLDTMLNRRGYADFRLTGTYSKEPHMADLIRTAKRNNYELFGYQRDKEDPDRGREEIQADNIVKYIENHPTEKVVILCGWYHAVESSLPERKKSLWMAHYLKIKHEIDPLTIYQDNFTEKVLQNEHSLMTKIQIDQHSVFIDNHNQIARLSDKVDVEVIHPKTKYVNGRPGWLYQDQTYKEYALDRSLLDIEFPILIKAYVLGEQHDGTPIDIIELKEKYDQRKLILKPGKYLLDITNKMERKEIEIDVE